jgi:hypothetical protein
MIEFVLAGFRQDNNIRRYSFQAVGVDRKGTEFTVGADLDLVRKYRIPLQELPLLCRHVLEGYGSGQTRALMFSENDMIGYATRRTAELDAAEQKRRAHRSPPPSLRGWRAR